MDVLELNLSGDSMEDTGEILASSEPPDIPGVFGIPELSPRVGDEYQVIIPPLMQESDCVQLVTNASDVEFRARVSHDFPAGLPIPLIWIKEDVEKDKHEHQESLENELHHTYTDKGNCLVPGSIGDSWSELEEAGFLLGLYIFGKNLVQLKKFLESKTMGDILSFYYGKFYKSDKYRRWSDCRKMRSRRCIYGHKIFTGPRQQELQSRLLSRVSEECQSSLLEVSKTFGDGQTTAEEYVFSLKALVGMNSLVEAVGIGTGKQDLTGNSNESSKFSQVVPVRPEIPVGKACSSLTTEEIIGFLTGDFRLSKARSNDLFWEAVWPRLLARGWHSEQPKDYFYIGGSKNSLVFLVPGVKKFSRRKLVKGNHYFDSVTDVLNRVAKNPGLLEFHLETGEGDGSKVTNEAKSDNDSDHYGENGDSSNQQRRYYLQPRTVNHDVDIVEFAVVDTSLARGGRGKVREVRCLPMQNFNTPMSKSWSGELESISSKDTTEDLESSETVCSQKRTDNSKPAKVVMHKGASSNCKVKGSASKHGILSNGQVSTSVTGKISEDQATDICNEKQSRKSKKCRPNRGMSTDSSFDIPPVVVVKRPRKLSVSSRPGTSQATRCFMLDRHGSKKEVHGRLIDPDSNQNSFAQVDPLQGKLSSANSSPENIAQKSSEGIHTSIDSTEKFPRKKPLPRTMIDIDLNLPISMDGESIGIEMREIDDPTNKQPDDLNASNTSTSLHNSEQVLSMNSRRQSTRNRPLTAKALDAIADGYFDLKARKKRGEPFSQENLISRPSRRARVRTAVNEDSVIVTEDMKEEVKANGPSTNGNGGIFRKSHIEAEGEETQVLGP